MSRGTTSLVESLLSRVSFAERSEGWSLIERFAVLVRESGSTDERAAAHFIGSRLENAGVPHDVYEPDLYLSIPKGASVAFAGEDFAGKPPSFAASTPKRGVSAAPIHVPANPSTDAADLFKSAHGSLPDDIAGKIVVTEGMPMPVSVARFEAAGAVGQVYINPGSRVHWGICTTVWGAPGESQLGLRPTTPVAAIDRWDGDKLVAAIADGLNRITLHTDLEEGWYPCQLPVARIDGQEEDFVLAHGHYDSWDVGIGDNAVGDATLLELAQIFHEHREDLRRSLRVAWWPAHSTGRYGGSTWFADQFALELSQRCVPPSTSTRPGCWGATEYDAVPWMAEAGEVCRSSIVSVAGVEPTRQRPSGRGLFVRPDRAHLFLHAALQHPPGGAGPARLLPRGRLWGQHRVAYGEGPDRGRGSRQPGARPPGLSDAIARFLEDEVLPLDFRETAAELGDALEAYEGAIDKDLGKVFNPGAGQRGLR